MSGFWYMVFFITICHFDLTPGNFTPQQRSIRSAELREDKNKPVRTTGQREPDNSESKLCEGDIQLNGTLGKSLVLFQLHEIHQDYKTLSLKYTQNQSKRKLLIYHLKSRKQDELPNITLSKYKFDRKHNAVMIHNLQKDDEKDYEILVEKKNGDEEFCNIKVKVYEQISNLTVSVTEDSQNDTCKVTMECLMQTGEDVTFSWMKDDETLSHNSSTLEINITNDNANSTFRCTAKNSVSEHSSNYTLSSACNPVKDDNHHGLILYILVPTFILLAIIVTVIIVIVIRKLRNKDMFLKRCISPPSSSQSRPAPPEPVSEETPEAVHTVYAIVRKPENQRTPSIESKSLPFSSVYELAGPCHPQLQNNEETRV